MVASGYTRARLAGETEGMPPHDLDLLCKRARVYASALAQVREILQAFHTEHLGGFPSTTRGNLTPHLHHGNRWPRRSLSLLIQQSSGSRRSHDAGVGGSPLIFRCGRPVRHNFAITDYGTCPMHGNLLATQAKRIASRYQKPHLSRARGSYLIPSKPPRRNSAQLHARTTDRRQFRR